MSNSPLPTLSGVIKNRDKIMALPESVRNHLMDLSFKAFVRPKLPRGMSEQEIEKFKQNYIQRFTTGKAPDIMNLVDKVQPEKPTTLDQLRGAAQYPAAGIYRGVESALQLASNIQRPGIEAPYHKPLQAAAKKVGELAGTQEQAGRPFAESYPRTAKALEVTGKLLPAIPAGEEAGAAMAPGIVKDIAQGTGYSLTSATNPKELAEQAGAFALGNIALRGAGRLVGKGITALRGAVAKPAAEAASGVAAKAVTPPSGEAAVSAEQVLKNKALALNPSLNINRPLHEVLSDLTSEQRASLAAKTKPGRRASSAKAKVGPPSPMAASVVSQEQVQKELNRKMFQAKAVELRAVVKRNLTEGEKESLRNGASVQEILNQPSTKIAFAKEPSEAELQHLTQVAPEAAKAVSAVKEGIKVTKVPPSGVVHASEMEGFKAAGGTRREVGSKKVVNE